MTPDERAASINGLADRLRSDADWFVRYGAAGTLSNMLPRPRRAVPTLKEALSDPSRMVRVAAAAALYHVLGEERWLRFLADHLKDPDPAVRRKSASLLGSQGPDAARTAPDLCLALQDENADVLGWAACALRQIAPPTQPVIEALIGRLAT